MKIPSEFLNKINDQIITLVEKYNFINNENLELKKEIDRLTAELEEVKEQQRFSVPLDDKKTEDTKQTVDQCLVMIEDCLTLVRDIQHEPRYAHNHNDRGKILPNDHQIRRRSPCQKSGKRDSTIDS